MLFHFPGQMKPEYSQWDKEAWEGFTTEKALQMQHVLPELSQGHEVLDFAKMLIYLKFSILF